jgi:hypothetical protein
MDLRKRVFFLLPAVVAAMLQNAVHELVHFAAARLLGEEVLEVRLFTNGWGTSQVIYATPVAERFGSHWLPIAWLPSVVTVLIGYLLYANRRRWLTRWPLLNALTWYGGLFFLCLDPFYLGFLSLFLGSDVDAVAAVGWSPWPVRIVALAVLVVNGRLMLQWRQESQAQPELYLAGKNASYLVACLGLAFLLIRLLPLGPAGPAGPLVTAHLDVTGAEAFIAFCQASAEGDPWDDEAIRQMVASAPYGALLTHHGRLDRAVTPEALEQMLVALRDGTPYTSESARLTRMYATHRWAMGEIPTLQARLEQLADPAAVERAAQQAQAALPAATRLEATVYILADGYSPAYVTGDTAVLDLLQIARADRLDRWLAHELHHAGVSSLLPERCTDPAVGITLDMVAGLVQEGSATYWIDGWRSRARESDYNQVWAFLLDVLNERLSIEEAEGRLAVLLGYEERGPLYRVGNTMIAELSTAHGDAWVQARLGDPVGLLRAYQRIGSWPGAGEVLAALDRHRRRCPAWFGRRW